jgi:putative Mn2+ efflux pump MntP
MMLANVPVIYLGHKCADRLSTKAVHVLAAIIFVVLGGLALRTALHPAKHSMFSQQRDLHCWWNLWMPANCAAILGCS